MSSGPTLRFAFARADKHEELAQIGVHVFGRGETILYADDDVDVLKVGRKMLESLGYRVLPASGGPEALSIAQTHDGPIDLLLTDVVMPGLDGFTLSLRVRAILPGIRCLFVSGYVPEALAQTCNFPQDGIFLEKPFTFAKLAECVRAVLDP